LELYVYARTLQRQGNAKRAFVYPGGQEGSQHWIRHVANARIDSNKGDFAAASKETSQALSTAPGPNKPQLEGLLKRLEAKDDINK